MSLFFSSHPGLVTQSQKLWAFRGDGDENFRSHGVARGSALKQPSPFWHSHLPRSSSMNEESARTLLLRLHFQFQLFWSIIDLPHCHSCFILFSQEYLMSLLYSPSNLDKQQQQQQHNFWPNIAVAERATARERDRLSARWLKASYWHGSKEKEWADCMKSQRSCV